MRTLAPFPASTYHRITHHRPVTASSSYLGNTTQLHLVLLVLLPPFPTLSTSRCLTVFCYTPKFSILWTISYVHDTAFGRIRSALDDYDASQYAPSATKYFEAQIGPRVARHACRRRRSCVSISQWRWHSVASRGYGISAPSG